MVGLRLLAANLLFLVLISAVSAQEVVFVRCVGNQPSGGHAGPSDADLRTELERVQDEVLGEGKKCGAATPGSANDPALICLEKEKDIARAEHGKKVAAARERNRVADEWAMNVMGDDEWAGERNSCIRVGDIPGTSIYTFRKQPKSAPVPAPVTATVAAPSRTRLYARTHAALRVYASPGGLQSGLCHANQQVVLLAGAPSTLNYFEIIAGSCPRGWLKPAAWGWLSWD